MKYKQKYEELLDQVKILEHSIEQRELSEREAKRDKEIAEAKYEENQRFLRKIEGRESDVGRENEWLKTTLRLVIVDADKIKGLVQELEKDQFSLNYKL